MWTPDNNTSLDVLLQWLEESRPNENLVLPGRYGLIFIYILSFVLSIIGNIIIIIVLVQNQHRPNHVTVYQLNLAVADLLMSLFCIPFTFAQAQLGHWPFGVVLCPVVLFLQLCLVSVSAYTNVAIGIDRFIGVTFPLKWKPTRNQRRVILAAVWSLSAFLGSPELVVGRSIDQGLGNTTQHMCNEYWRDPEEKKTFTLMVLLLVLVLPLLLLGITYSSVVYTLWIRETPGNADIRRDRKRLASKKKVTRMLIVVVMMFGFCWLPIHLFNFILDFWPELVYTSSEQTLQIVFFACHWLAMSHAFVNPLVYIGADTDFREKVWILLMCKNQICVDQALSNTGSGTQRFMFTPSPKRMSLSTTSVQQEDNRRTHGPFKKCSLKKTRSSTSTYQSQVSFEVDSTITSQV